MENFLGFCFVLAISVFVYWFLIPSKWRNLFLLICSFIFIAFLSIPPAIYFLFNITVVYFAGKFINKGDKNKKFLTKLILFWLIGNLCFFKYANLLFKINPWPILIPKIKFTEILFPLGLSFITFRLIHYIVEVYRKNITETSFIIFALYVLFFPTFLAGPIERFPRFHLQAIEEKNIEVSNINYGLLRIIIGIIKKAFIADNLLRLISHVFASPGLYTRIIILCSIYSLAIVIYMDFSGYTDIAIGIARLFGYKIMENFNKPLLQKNIVSFVRNWHISLYTWIRDYFFFPVFGTRTSKVKLCIGIFVTMFVVNLWHKASLEFLFAGVYGGIGIIAWVLFQWIKKRYTLVQNLFSYKWLGIFSYFCTFSWFSFNLLIAHLEIKQTLDIIKRIFI